MDKYTNVYFILFLTLSFLCFVFDFMLISPLKYSIKNFKNVDLNIKKFAITQFTTTLLAITCFVHILAKYSGDTDKKDNMYVFMNFVFMVLSVINFIAVIYELRLINKIKRFKIYGVLKLIVVFIMAVAICFNLSK